MDQEVIRRRNAVFIAVYTQTLLAYRCYIPVPLRWFLEICLLCLALMTFLLWSYIHFTYIMGSEDCLHSITHRPFPSDVILQVEVYSNDTELWLKRQYKIDQIYNDIYSKSCPADSGAKKHRFSQFTRDEFVAESCNFNGIMNSMVLQYVCHITMDIVYTSLELMDIFNDHIEQNMLGKDSIAASTRNGPSLKSSPHITRSKPSPPDMCPKIDIFITTYKKEHDDLHHIPSRKDFGKNYTLFELFDYYELQVVARDYTIFEFSQESGYLSLSKSSRYKLGIPVQKLYVDPHESTCFGGLFGQFLTKYFLGYDMMVISSFKDLMPQTYGMGYVKNLMSGNQYYYRVQWMGKWRYGAGILPALFFTLVASVLLRQIHYHIFKFLTHFNHLMNQGVPMPIQTGAQIPFLVITYATIGLIIVMSEVLSDDSVFSLLMVGTVWQVDQFYSVYCRQRISKIYLPWFFFLFHFLPYAYYIRFNGQFWFFPFLFHWLMLQHAMMYFIHHYEIPALNRIHPVAVQRPRHQVNVVRARPLTPSDVETAQMPRANFTQLNSTVLQPAETEAQGSLDQQSSDELHIDGHDTSSEASISTDSLLRSGLHQTDSSSSSDSSSSYENHAPHVGGIPLVPVEESGELFGPHLSDNDLRLARLCHLQKNQGN